jgi:hypothetical protein
VHEKRGRRNPRRRPLLETLKERNIKKEERRGQRTLY